MDKKTLKEYFSENLVKKLVAFVLLISFNVNIFAEVVPVSKGLNTYGIQKGSVYIKYYNKDLVRNPLLSNHYLSAIGLEIGYDFESVI